MREGRVLGLLGILAALSCADQGRGDEATTVERSAVINGVTATATDANQAFIDVGLNCDEGGALVTTGTGVFLTNNWLVTAAHVVDGRNDSGTCTNGSLRANNITVTLGSQSKGNSQIDAVLLHPRANDLTKPRPTDIALVHFTSPFQLNGSTSGYERLLSDLRIADMIGLPTRCFGYGRSSRTSNASGVFRSADFIIGSSTTEPHTKFVVFKGGGTAPNDSGNGRILSDGDSGGGCVATTGPAGRQTVFGIHHGSRVNPAYVCERSSDCPENGTCENGSCSTNDAPFSEQVATPAFRDFAHAALRSESPPVQVDFDGNGNPDMTLIIRTVNGFFVMDFVRPDGTTTIPTVIPNLPIANNAIQNFAAVNTGDFNNDGTTDLLGLIGGQHFYFNSDLGSINFLNPFNGTLGITPADGFAFSMIRDFNGDGFDDAELVRPDGSSRLFLGGPTGLGNASPPPSYGPDFDGDGIEDIAFSAPGSPFGPIAGAVHLLFGNGDDDYWSADTTDGPGDPETTDDDDDFFGSQLAWGNFDSDGPDELVVTSARGLRYIDQGRSVDNTRFISQREVVDEPFTVGFGSSLAAGDFDGDGFDDIAAAAGNGEGRIVILFGGPGGLSESSRAQTVHGTEVDPAIDGIVSLAAGDFNCDGRDDLAFGSFLFGDRGVVGVFYGAQNGLSELSNQLWDASAVGVGPASKDNDHFGSFIVAGNFNGDEQAGRACHDLAISATEQDGGGIERAGVVYVLYSNGTILQESGADLLEPCCGEPFFPEGNGGFGHPMAISHLNTDNFDDLLVGWPTFQGSGVADGQVFAYAGGASGLGNRQRWSNPGGEGGLSFGQGIGGTSTGLVVVGTPFGNGGVVDVFEQNGISRGTSRRFVPADLAAEGERNFGREVTGPRPGRPPALERPRATLATLSAQLTEAMSVMSFEDPLRAWTSTAPLTIDPARKTKGLASLKVGASGYVAIDSAPFGTAELERVGTKLALDVFVPQTQPNPTWLGDVQMSFTAAAANVNNTYIGYAPLTGLVRGQWNTVEFTVPSNVLTTLLGDFPRARFTIAVNTPGGAQPLNLDNLRFRGTFTRRTVRHKVPAPVPAGSNPLFGFETLSDWTSPQVTLAQTTLHVAEGSAALSIPAGGYREIRSRPFSTSALSGVTPVLALSVFIPSNQSNPSWVGDVQAFFSCPSIGMNNVPLGQVILTNLFFDEYNRVKFNLPANVVAALTTSHADAQISFALNVSASSGRYLFDNLAFAAN